MKAENGAAQWKDILDATSYTDVEELKARWREIKDKLPDIKKDMEAKKDHGGKKDKSSNSNSNHNSNKSKARDPDREARVAKAREEGLKRQQEAREKREAAAMAGRNKVCLYQPRSVIPTLASLSLSHQTMAYADGFFTDYFDFQEQAKAITRTRREPGEMRVWADSYDKKKWKLLASRHFDMTGQRITPEEARKMMQGK
jgi:hypothetical protein